MSRSDLLRAVEALISDKTGKGGRISSRQAAGGGCINNAERIVLDDGRSFFLKSNAAPLPRLFECEAEGLAALHAAGAIRVPAPIGTGGGADGVPAFIVMEYIQPGRAGARFQSEMGRRFALLHQGTQHDRHGFMEDNYLGSTLQPNGWMMDWVGFWRERRLGYQLQLARQKGLSDATMDRLGDRLMDRLDGYLREPAEPACLLHGDLWGGNYLADGDGAPVLIDPAAYHGRREADLAMTMLFGGFTRDFYSAYNAVWPLADGHDARLDIYKLYHLLNHLNLFGTGYRGQCVEIMRRYAG